MFHIDFKASFFPPRSDIILRKLNWNNFTNFESDPRHRPLMMLFLQISVGVYLCSTTSVMGISKLTTVFILGFVVLCLGRFVLVRVEQT